MSCLHWSSLESHLFLTSKLERKGDSIILCFDFCTFGIGASGTKPSERFCKAVNAKT